jgi:hypothetical protein
MADHGYVAHLAFAGEVRGFFLGNDPGGINVQRVRGRTGLADTGGRLLFCKHGRAPDESVRR